MRLALARLSSMLENKRTIILAALGIAFVSSTIYMSFYLPQSRKTPESGELLSVLSKTNEKGTGLEDVKEGETLPNWKLAVIKQAEKDAPEINTLAPTAVDTTNLNNPNNITAQYAKNVYAATAILEQESGTLTEEQRAAIAKAIFEQEALKASAKIYSLSDIKTIPSSKESVKKYGNTLGGMVTLAIVEGDKYPDIDLFQEYGLTRKKETLVLIDKKISIVEDLRDNMLLISVPTTATVYHLSALNAVEAYLQTLKNMRAIDTDALRASIGAHDYLTVYQTAFSMINAFSEYFDMENIVFQPSENGYLFTKGLIGP